MLLAAISFIFYRNRRLKAALMPPAFYGQQGVLKVFNYNFISILNRSSEFRSSVVDELVEMNFQMKFEKIIILYIFQKTIKRMHYLITVTNVGNPDTFYSSSIKRLNPLRELIKSSIGIKIHYAYFFREYFSFYNSISI